MVGIIMMIMIVMMMMMVVVVVVMLAVKVMVMMATMAGIVQRQCGSKLRNCVYSAGNSSRDLFAST